MPVVVGWFGFPFVVYFDVVVAIALRVASHVATSLVFGEVWCFLRLLC